MTPKTAEGSEQLPVCQQLNHLLRNYDYKSILVYGFFYTFAIYEGSAWITPFGSSWFGGCKTRDSQNSGNIDNCNNDYNSWNMWSTGSLSIQGLISFLFSGYIGRLSDGKSIYI